MMKMMSFSSEKRSSYPMMTRISSRKSEITPSKTIQKQKQKQKQKQNKKKSPNQETNFKKTETKKFNLSVGCARRLATSQKGRG